MKQEILNIAIEKINKETDIVCHLIDSDLPKGGNSQIELNYGGVINQFTVEVQKQILPNNITHIVELAKDVNSLFIVTEYVTKKAQELLIQHNIPFCDTAGNIFLKTKNIYINIQTGKTNRGAIQTKTKAFNKAGLKVIYQFLLNPDYLNKSYRFIGEKAKVTIATVGVVIKGLLQEKYIIQLKDKEYQFIDRKRLFEEWVKEYNRNLRPKLTQKRYRWLNKNQDWKSIKLPKETYWGDTCGAELLTEYLIADRFEIYTGISFQEVSRSLKLIPDKMGDVVIKELFWKDVLEHENIVSPILIYADLMFEANPRYLETADKIYKDYVQDQL